jgi:isoprenylcysteine carboxyl methyltransferase (ICMT) family protein YpbQ
LLIGALLLLFSIIIDYSDGEVARYKNQKSAEGSYLDKFYHFTVHSFIFLGLTIGAQENNSDQLIWICGWISSISIILLSLTRGYIILIVLSIKFRRLLNNIISDETAVNDIQSQVGIIKRETRPIDPLMYKKDNNLNQSKNSRMHRYISYITTFWDFPYFLLLIIIVSIVQYSLSPITYCGYTPLELLIVFFGITTPSLILLFVFNRLVTMKVSKKVDELQNDLFYIFSCKNSDH